MNKSIFEKGLYIDPEYNDLEKYVYMMYRGFWTPAKYEKLIKEVDAPYFFNSMSELDQELIRRCILAISLVEDKVKLYWGTLALDLPQTIIGDVGALFGQSEATHRRSYHSLAKVLNIDTEDIDKYPALSGRVKYLQKHSEGDPKIRGRKRVLKKLVLFTSLVERISLFTQFYILMSYEKSSRGLKTISALQTSTASEETIHYSFGIDVINKIKKQHPNLWDEYLVETVVSSIEEAYKAETELLNWFFENGAPDHLSKEEVTNFLNYNFNIVTRDLGVDLKYEVDEEMFREKNEWFNIKLKSSEPDFFDNPAGGYASEKEEIDLDNFEF